MARINHEVKVEGTRILFADHAVALNVDSTWDEAFVREYLKEMADSLSAGGTREDHDSELLDMSNDGSWSCVDL